MGYYDTQHVQPNSGGQPYNVRDILLATQGVTGGLDKLVADAGADRKAQQQMKANEYVSDLLGKTDSNNYDQNSAKLLTMGAYASPEMQNKLDAYGKNINSQRENDYRNNALALQGTQVANEYAHGQDTLSEDHRRNVASELLQNKTLDATISNNKAQLGMEMSKLQWMKEHGVAELEIQKQNAKVAEQKAILDDVGVAALPTEFVDTRGNKIKTTDLISYSKRGLSPAYSLLGNKTPVPPPPKF